MAYEQARDPFAGTSRGIEGPASTALLLTPSDGADLGSYARALRIYVPLSLGAASVRITPALAADDTPVTLTFLAGVFIEPLAIRKLWSTGTTPAVVVHGYGV